MKNDGCARNRALASESRLLKKDCSELLLRSTEELSSNEEHDDEDSDTSDDEWGPYFEGPTRVFDIPFTGHTGRTAYMGFSKSSIFSTAARFSRSRSTSRISTQTRSTPTWRTSSESSLVVKTWISALTCTSSLVSASLHASTITAAKNPREEATRHRNVPCMPRDDVHPLSGMTGQLPGMVGSYEGFRAYRSALFIHSAPGDWRQGPRTLRYVEFDKYSEADCEHVPPATSEDVFMNRHHPEFDRADPHTLNRADLTMYDMTNSADYEEFLEVWQKATSRGWTAW